MNNKKESPVESSNNVKRKLYRNIAIIVIVVVSSIIAYFGLRPNPGIKNNENPLAGTQSISSASDNEGTNEPKILEKDVTEAAPTSVPTIERTNDLKIFTKDITETAKFYPYKVDNVDMQVIAVKATDGTIRTALNTCQVCFDSGRGYYVQVGQYLVCQNCKNRFHIDQVEQVKGGCNPVPILEENKKYEGDYIIISEDYLASQKGYFIN